MPGSVRSIRIVDATSPIYDSDEETPPIVRRRKSNLVEQIQLPPSPADSEDAMREASPRGRGSPSATAMEEDRITRPLERGAPGDRAIFSDGKTPERRELAKRKSQYYGEAFATRESNTSARERVTKESMIIADVRTNVIVHDEYTFTTDLSYYLSQRYQRPENSIVVILTHSLCMLFAGNFEPAYTLTITALPCQTQPVTNKRNATLLGAHMQESLKVTPRRGIIKFSAIAEENFANDGRTVSGEIEDLERELADTNLQRSASRVSTKSRKRQSMKSLRGQMASPMPTHDESAPPTPAFDHTEFGRDEQVVGVKDGNANGSTGEGKKIPVPATPVEMSELDRKAEKAQRMGRRKSFIATIFGKGGKVEG